MPSIGGTAAARIRNRQRPLSDGCDKVGVLEMSEHGRRQSIRRWNYAPAGRAMILGVSPLSPISTRWYKGACAEIAVVA